MITSQTELQDQRFKYLYLSSRLGTMRAAAEELELAVPDSSVGRRPDHRGDGLGQFGVADHHRQREFGQMLVCVSRAKSEGGRLVLDL